MSTITAKDLSKEAPRSPYVELDGLPWLARLIDKVRAHEAGTAADYIPYPCGGDKNFLATFGLEAEAMRAQIASGASDEQVLAFVKQHLPADWEAKRDAYKAEARTGIPAGTEYHGYLVEAIKELVAAKPGVDTSKIDNFARLICVEEGHALP